MPRMISAVTVFSESFITVRHVAQSQTPGASILFIDILNFVSVWKSWLGLEFESVAII